MKLLILLVVCVVLICTIEGRKHHKKGKERKRHMQLESVKDLAKKHSSHPLHHHHSQKRNHLNKKKKKINKPKASKKRPPTGIREQVRDFQEKLNKMLPRCTKTKKCPKDTCCWKGRCKMQPHRINQRCSVDCPCKDAKGTLYCHVKRGKNRRHKYGRCYIRGKSIGGGNVNFIPKMIERFRVIEKKMAGEKKEG